MCRNKYATFNYKYEIFRQKPHNKKKTTTAFSERNDLKWTSHQAKKNARVQQKGSDTQKEIDLLR